MRYSVHCPSAPYENSSFVNLDDCWGLCLDLSVEYGYAEVRYGNCMLGSYTLGQWAKWPLFSPLPLKWPIITEYQTKTP